MNESQISGWLKVYGNFETVSTQSKEKKNNEKRFVQITGSFSPTYLAVHHQLFLFDSVAAGENSSESTAAFVVQTHFNTELTKTIDFDFLYNFQILNEASGTYNHHMVAAFETELTRWLDLDVSLVWDRIQDPQPDADGIEPEQDDFYLIVGLGIEF